MNGIIHDPLSLGLLAILTFLLPALGVWDYRRLLRHVREGRANARRRAYLWTIALQWTLTLGFMSWWLLSNRTLAPLRLISKAAGLQWLVIAAGIAAVALLLIQMVTTLRSRDSLEKVRQQSRDLLELAPRSPAERRAFVLLSITAGVCEEILYRGLLIAVLSAVVGTWPAVILSTVIFGLGHAYQGVKGIVKTGAAGLVLALLAVGSGSLFIPILLHAVGDLTSGRILGAATRGASADTTRASSPALETTA